MRLAQFTVYNEKLLLLFRAAAVPSVVECMMIHVFV